MLKVIVLSASKYSLFTISIVEELIRNDIHVQAVVVQNLFSSRRLIREFKKNPLALLKKIFKKLIFRTYSESNKLSMAKVFKEKSYVSRSLDDIEKNYGIQILYCDNFHEDKVIQDVKSQDCDLMVFTGGGIIKEKLLSIPKIGILNCHMGILPTYRGMDCHTWSILNNDFNNIGLTTHFMDEGIDTGNILKIKKIRLDDIDRYEDIEDALEYHMPDFTMKTILEINKSIHKETLQNQDEGKQYFSIKDQKLIKKAKQKFTNFKVVGR